MTSQLIRALAGIGLLCASSFSASAFPTVAPLDTGASSMLQPIAQGCGPGGWRGPYGGCRFGRFYRAHPFGGYYRRFYRVHPFGGYYRRFYRVHPFGGYYRRYYRVHPFGFYRRPWGYYHRVRPFGGFYGRPWGGYYRVRPFGGFYGRPWGYGWR